MSSFLWKWKKLSPCARSPPPEESQPPRPSGPGCGRGPDAEPGETNYVIFVSTSWEEPKITQPCPLRILILGLYYIQALVTFMLGWGDTCASSTLGVCSFSARTAQGDVQPRGQQGLSEERGGSFTDKVHFVASVDSVLEKSRKLFFILF